MGKLPRLTGGMVGAGRRSPRRVWRIARRLGGRPSRREPLRDVWQWATRKYRIRAVVLLLLNGVLFAGLGCFTYWLRTGEYTPFGAPDYWGRWWEAFDPTHERQITLLDFLLYPIPVDQVPMMIVIVALVLASLTAIPILVSILYRFPFSLIFVVIIGFVAVLPWLALCVTLCCVLARWRPLRFSFRFATALLSLIPLVGYYLLATRNAAVAARLPPVEIAKLYVPWVLAIIAACIVMGLVLTIARLVNYRPGAISPLLALMFAIPVVLFEAKVGRDELYYRLLEFGFGPASRTHFVDDVDMTQAIERIAELRLRERDDRQAAGPSAMEQVRLTLQFQLAPVRAEERRQAATTIQEAFALQQHEAVTACRTFRQTFPHSRYIPNALYIEGRAIDMRIDQDFFARTLMLRHYHDFPNAASEPTWRMLHDGCSESPLTSVAGLRLAMLTARRGQVDEAIPLLADVIERFGDVKGKEAPPPAPAGGWKGILVKRPASSTLDVQPPTVAHEGRKLLDLLKNNRDPDHHHLPLQELLKLDPHHPMYAQNLERLLAGIDTKYPWTRLGDNLRVLLAAADPSRSNRIDRLKTLIAELEKAPETDALPRARFELGAVYHEDSRPVEARKVFEQVLRLHGESPWAAEANRCLAKMGVAGRST